MTMYKYRRFGRVMTLAFSRYPTNAGTILQDATSRLGTKPFRQGRWHNNWNLFEGLLGMKLLEERPSGPRGGARYHATRTGRAALKRVAAHIEGAA